MGSIRCSTTVGCDGGREWLAGQLAPFVFKCGGSVPEPHIQNLPVFTLHAADLDPGEKCM